MKLYALSGLGVDSRLFKHLDINYELIPIEWIEPLPDESIDSYTKRLSQPINTSEEFGILGVSFGGIIATEMSKLLEPKLTVLISSAETKHELRTIYRFLGYLNIIKYIPISWFKIPKFPSLYIFGTKNKALLYPILEDTDPKFAKWAINTLLIWKNNTKLKEVLKISGSHDKLLPANKHSNIVLIPNEGHFIIADRAKKVSQLINTYISSKLPTI